MQANEREEARMRILMYDDHRNVTETILDVHVCRGEHDCAAPSALCEQCGSVACADRPVYVWTVENGITFFACAECLVDDPYCDLSADPIE